MRATLGTSLFFKNRPSTYRQRHRVCYVHLVETAGGAANAPALAPDLGGSSTWRTIAHRASSVTRTGPTSSSGWQRCTRSSPSRSAPSPRARLPQRFARAASSGPLHRPARTVPGPCRPRALLGRGARCANVRRAVARGGASTVCSLDVSPYAVRPRRGEVAWCSGRRAGARVWWCAGAAGGVVSRGVPLTTNDGTDSTNSPPARSTAVTR